MGGFMDMDKNCHPLSLPWVIGCECLYLEKPFMLPMSRDKFTPRPTTTNKALWTTGVFPDLGADAGLSNFWKNRVWVRQDAAIKKLLKIFLFIFSIYFKGKNIFLFWESMQTTSFSIYIFYMLSFSFQIYFQRQEIQNKKENTKEVTNIQNKIEKWQI